MKHTLKMVAHLERDLRGEEKYCLFSSDMSAYGYTPVGEVVVKFETQDDFDPIAAEIAALHQANQKIQADAQIEVNSNNCRIAKLSCAESKPEASHA